MKCVLIESNTDPCNYLFNVHLRYISCKAVADYSHNTVFFYLWLTPYRMTKF